METELKKAFTWEIDNFSERNDEIDSDPFSIGGCEWYVTLGNIPDYLSVYLAVWNPESLRLGWKRKVTYYIVLLNQSGKELCRSPDEITCNDFCLEASCWGFPKMFPLNKLQEEAFLENNKLTVEVYIKAVEVVHQGKSTENDMLDYNGFKVVASQVQSMSQIFYEHPDIDVDFRPKSQVVKTAYMNVLLGLIETLNKHPLSLSETDLSNAHSELSELTEAGFKLDWLMKKLEDVFLERKKTNSNDSQVQKLEERIKYLELTVLDLKDEMEKEKIRSADVADEVYSFEFIDYFLKRFFLSCFAKY